MDTNARKGSMTDLLFSRITPIATLLLVIILLIRSCFPAPSAVQGDAVTPPAGSEVCSSSGDGVYLCMGNSTAGITFSNVPPEVIPYVLPVSEEEKAALNGLPKDGFECLGPVLENIAFYENNEGQHLITHFWNPITIEIDLHQVASQETSGCVYDLLKDEQPTKVFPVYLYIPQSGEDVQIWKPFQSFVVDPETWKVTITFTTWGDQRVGIGGTYQIGYGPKP